MSNVSPSELQISVPEFYRATTGHAATGRRGASPRRPRSKFDPVPLAAGPAAELSRESAAIVEALEKQELQLVEEVTFEPIDALASPLPGQPRRAVPSGAAAQTAELKLKVQPNEDAVVLVKQDGVYSWVFPVRRIEGPGPGGTRRAVAGETLLSFQIDLQGAGAAERRGARRGFLSDLVFSQVKAFVLKFAARIAVGQAMKFLERNVSRGMVIIDSVDPAAWKRVEDLSSLKLPADRAARILLFVHGTFSSTTGSFGALGGTPWGVAFLEGVLANYDAVIGFDHATLSEDPLENAVDLLGRLQRTAWPHPPQVDAVAYSRGALVLRSLVEQLLPPAKWGARFERAVFIGSTNGGTALAEPDNWHDLMDLYTNLATGAARLLSLMPQAAAPMTILSETLQGLGALVKYMATEAVTAGGIPGLAAMEADGKFVTSLNGTQPGQLTPQETWFYAITSDFKARLLDGEHEPKELPRRLVFSLANGLVDRLMKQAPNDLVVDTPSMTRIDPEVGGFVRDTLDFGTNPQVYHLNYFTRPEVANALTRWLQLAAPATPVVPLASGLHRGITLPPLHAPAPVFRPGSDEVPAMVDTDFYMMDASTPAAEAIDAVKAAAPSFVIVRSSFEDKALNYAVPTDAFVREVEACAPDHSVRVALDLHEDEQTASRSVASLPAATADRAYNRMEIVFAGDELMGVLPPMASLPTGMELVKLASQTLEPRTAQDRVAARRALPTFSAGKPRFGANEPRGAATRGIAVTRGGFTPRRGGASGDGPFSSGAVAAMTCHFRAEMEEQVQLQHVATIEVTISREMIGGRVSESRAEGSGPVDPARNLIVQVLPKRNFEMLGDDRLEIPPPSPQDPQTFYFDVRATHDDGGEGEIWVVVRQGQIPIVRLTLRPRIASRRPAPSRRAVSSASAAEAEAPAAPLTQLFITEQINGSELRYKFQLQNMHLGFLVWDTSKPIRSNREQYVRRLYSEIENRWLRNKDDVENFYEELRAYGAELFEELVPAKIQQALWEHRDRIDSIMVIAEEPFIPWEVVNLIEPGKPLSNGSRFFGEMGLVRWLEEAGFPKQSIPFGAGRRRYIIPDYPDPGYKLPEAQAEAEFLREKHHFMPVEPTSSEVRKFLSSGEFDVLHFACHGEAEQDNVSNAALLMLGRLEGANYIRDYLNASTAEFHSHFPLDERPGPMIFLNACQVGRASYKLTGTGGFARAFLRRGARAFVGALWSVGDHPAMTFTKEFYEQLTENGASVAEATKLARAAAQEAGDATWLAYVVYAHPHAILS